MAHSNLDAVSAPSSPPREPLVRLPSRDGAEVRVNLSEYRGGHYLDLRVWYLTPEGAWRPTRKGVTVLEEQAPDLLEAIRKGIAEIGRGTRSAPNSTAAKTRGSQAGSTIGIGLG